MIDYILSRVDRSFSAVEAIVVRAWMRRAFARAAGGNRPADARDVLAVLNATIQPGRLKRAGMALDAATEPNNLAHHRQILLADVFDRAGRARTVVRNQRDRPGCGVQAHALDQQIIAKANDIDPVQARRCRVEINQDLVAMGQMTGAWNRLQRSVERATDPLKPDR